MARQQCRAIGLRGAGAHRSAGKLLSRRRRMRYVVLMKDTMPADAIDPEFENETSVERDSRIKREAALIAKAHAEIEAGLGIELDDLEAWLDALETDENTPLPVPRGAV